MARTTVERVRRTLGKPGADVELEIETAAVWVDSRLADVRADGSSCTYSDAELEIIERYMAAHLWAVANPAVRREEVDTEVVEYESKVDVSLNLTRFGQQILMLDRCRRLTSVRLRLYWLGTERAEGGTHGRRWIN